MPGRPAISVVDAGGELDDVRALLDELGVHYASPVKSEDAPAELDPPRQLLVVTAAEAVSAGYQRTRRDGDATWVAVSGGDSRTQRGLLLEAGFDYWLQRPVHTAALRLLLGRALYLGKDTRHGARVAVGYAVGLRRWLRTRPATLVDLAEGGCRVLTRDPVPAGRRVRLLVPGKIDGGSDFSVSAVSLRVRDGHSEGGEPGEYSVALRFHKPDVLARRRVRTLLAALAAGPALLESVPGGERRQRRVHYGEEVLEFGSARSVLVGRDLSCGGMRVEPHPGLAVGEAVRLALPAEPGEESLVLAARVVRDDRAQGLALRFEALGPEDRRRISRIVERHPVIRSLESEQAASGNLVLSRLVWTLRRMAGLARD